MDEGQLTPALVEDDRTRLGWRGEPVPGEGRDLGGLGGRRIGYSGHLTIVTGAPMGLSRLTTRLKGLSKSVTEGGADWCADVDRLVRWCFGGLDGLALHRPVPRRDFPAWPTVRLPRLFPRNLVVRRGMGTGTPPKPVVVVGSFPSVAIVIAAVWVADAARGWAAVWCVEVGTFVACCLVCWVIDVLAGYRPRSPAPPPSHPHPSPSPRIRVSTSGRQTEHHARRRSDYSCEYAARRASSTSASRRCAGGSAVLSGFARRALGATATRSSSAQHSAGASSMLLFTEGKAFVSLELRSDPSYSPGDSLFVNAGVEQDRQIQSFPLVSVFW